MTKTNKIIIAVLLAVFVLIPAALVLAVALPAHAGGRHTDNRHDMRCYHHDWTRWAGVSPFPNPVTEIRVHARACVWQKSAHDKRGHYKGHVVSKATRTTERWNDNGWASFYGLDFYTYDKYKIQHNRGAFSDSRGFYDKWRQCQGIGSLKLCPNSGSFVVGWQFTSPTLLHVCAPGSCSGKWDLLYHEGKPGESPHGEDDQVFLRTSD